MIQEIQFKERGVDVPVLRILALSRPLPKNILGVFYTTPMITSFKKVLCWLKEYPIEKGFYLTL